jgi:hypothetical protein
MTRKVAKKTAKKTPKLPALIPQPNGKGALLAGGLPGNKGGGRPPDAIRAMAADASYDIVVPKFIAIVRTSHEEANVISAGRELLKVGVPQKQQIDITHPMFVAEAERYLQVTEAVIRKNVSPAVADRIMDEIRAAIRGEA